MKGVDLSWPQRDFSLADAQTLVADGREFVFIARNPSNVNAEQQRGYCRQAGIQHIHEYLESQRDYWPDFWPETRYVGFAVERNSGYQTRDEIRAVVDAIRAAGKLPICYTSASAWNEAGLDGFDCASLGVLLWVAWYPFDGQPRGRALSVIEGGWDTNAIHQYSGNGHIPGIGYELDLDEADRSLFETAPIIPTPQEDEMQTAPLDQGESIAAFNSIALRLGQVIGDEAGETVEVVTAPAPPPGYKRYVFTVKE